MLIEQWRREYNTIRPHSSAPLPTTGPRSATARSLLHRICPGLTADGDQARPDSRSRAAARLRSLRATKGSEGSPTPRGTAESGRWSRSDEVGDLLFGVPGRPKTSQIGSLERFRDYLRAVRAPGIDDRDLPRGTGVGWISAWWRPPALPDRE